MVVLQIVIVLIVIGVLLFLVNKYIPMASVIKKILNIVAVVGTIVWLLYASGVWDLIKSVKV